jgi:hypothetical protein
MGLRARDGARWGFLAVPRYQGSMRKWVPTILKWRAAGISWRGVGRLLYGLGAYTKVRYRGNKLRRMP